MLLEDVTETLGGSGVASQFFDTYHQEGHGGAIDTIWVYIAMVNDGYILLIMVDIWILYGYYMAYG